MDILMNQIEFHKIGTTGFTDIFLVKLLDTDDTGVSSICVTIGRCQYDYKFSQYVLVLTTSGSLAKLTEDDLSRISYGIKQFNEEYNAKTRRDNKGYGYQTGQK